MPRCLDCPPSSQFVVTIVCDRHMADRIARDGSRWFDVLLEDVRARYPEKHWSGGGSASAPDTAKPDLWRE